MNQEEIQTQTKMQRHFITINGYEPNGLDKNQLMLLCRRIAIIRLATACKVENAKKKSNPIIHQDKILIIDWLNKTFKDMENKKLPISQKLKTYCLEIILNQT